MSKKVVRTVSTRLKIDGKEYSVKPEITEDNQIRLTATGIEKGLKTIYQKDFSLQEIKKLYKPARKSFDKIDTIFQELLKYLGNPDRKLTNRGDSIDLVIDEDKKIILQLDKIYSGYVDDLKSIKEENSKLKGEIKALKRKNDLLQEELTNQGIVHHDFDEEYSEKLNKMTKKIESLEYQINELEDIVKERDATISECNDNLKEYKKINQNLVSTNKKLVGEIEEKDQIITDLQEEINDCKEVLEQYQEENTEDASKKGTQIFELQKKLRDKEKENRLLRDKYERLLEEYENSKIQNTKLETITEKIIKEPTVVRSKPKPLPPPTDIDINRRPQIFLSGKEIINSSEVFESYEEITMIERRLGRRNVRMSLAYKASEDGDRAALFHEFVRDMNNTLIVVKTTTGQRFGGFTTETWDGINIFKEDPYAFVFSLNDLKVYNVNENGIAIWCYPKYGPIFEGYQIDIFDHFLTKDISKTGLKGLGYGTTKDYELNGGEENFLVQELEIYQLED